MWNACKLLWSLLIGLLRSRASLEAENLVLREQIVVLRRTAPKRLRFSALDRLIFVGFYRRFPDLRDVLAVSGPDRYSMASCLGSERIGAGDRGLAGEDRRCRLQSAI